jgi:hypothetical protein
MLIISNGLVTSAAAALIAATGETASVRTNR